MTKFPHLPLWTDVWINDTKHLSITERGLYMDLLILMWHTPRCRIPNEKTWLIERLRLTENELPLLEKIIMQFCRKIGGGHWIEQKRLKKEYNYVSKKIIAGSNSAKARWNKQKNDTTYTYTYNTSSNEEVTRARARGTTKSKSNGRTKHAGKRETTEDVLRRALKTRRRRETTASRGDGGEDY